MNEDKLRKMLERNISEQLNISPGNHEPILSYYFRLVYSAIGRLTHASLYDRFDDSLEITKNHLTGRVRETIKAYAVIFPDIAQYLEADDMIPRQMYRLLKENGCLYHRKHHLMPVPFRIMPQGNIAYIRGRTNCYPVYTSGIGQYIVNKASHVNHTIEEVIEFFGLSTKLSAGFWNHIMENCSFQVQQEEYLSDAEYLRINGAFSHGYWLKQADSDETVLRTGIKENRTYYLYRKNEHGIRLAVLPTSCFDPYLLVNLYLYQHGCLPASSFVVDGDIIFLNVGFIYPKREQSLMKLYSWPLWKENVNQFSIDDNFQRVFQKNVFLAWKSLYEGLGYKFEEKGSRI